MAETQRTTPLPKPTAEDYRRSVEARIEELDESLGRHIDEVLNLLSEDLPRYVFRQVKAHYLADPDWAERLPETQLREIREAVERAGREITAKIVEPLRDRQIWTDRSGAPEGWGTDLDDHPAVWKLVQRASEDVAALLERHGFPHKNPAPYRVPTWTAHGRILRQAVDACWRELTERWALLGHLENQELHQKIDRLADRWDGASRVSP